MEINGELAKEPFVRVKKTERKGMKREDFHPEKTVYGVYG